jgi:hypothetical protein
VQKPHIKIPKLRLPLVVDPKDLRIYYDYNNGTIERIQNRMFKDRDYLERLKQRAQTAALVHCDGHLDETKLVAFVRNATGRDDNDWRALRVARTANLPLNEIVCSNVCGRMFLHQTVFLPLWNCSAALMCLIIAPGKR